MTKHCRKRAAVSSERNCEYCAASSRQSGGTTGKMRSTRFDGTSDIMSNPPNDQQTSHPVSGDILVQKLDCFKRSSFAARKLRIARPIISKLQGANLCSRCRI